MKNLFFNYLFYVVSEIDTNIYCLIRRFRQRNIYRCTPLVTRTVLYMGMYTGSSRASVFRELSSILPKIHLPFFCIDDIVKRIERTFYTNKTWHFKYSIYSMIKLFVVKCFRKLSFDKTISSLTGEEAILLSFLMKVIR